MRFLAIHSTFCGFSGRALGPWLLCLALAACSGGETAGPSLSSVDAASTATDTATGAGSDTAADADSGPGGDDTASAEVQAVACSGQSQCPGDSACFAGYCAAAVACKSDKTCLSLDAVCDSAAGHCVQCEESVDCADGGSCKDRVCVAPGKSCASTKECDSDQVCDKELGQCVQCVESSDCADGLSCVDHLCQPLQCQDGEASCKDLGIRQLCNGGTWIEAPCSAAEVCQGGACKAKVCVPGSGQCAGGKLQTCDGLGLGWSAGVACKDGEVCLKDACVASNCSAGQSKCAGNAVESCGADGQWKSAACPSSHTCVSANGTPQCKPLICTPNSKTCQGNAVTTCDASGTAKTLGAACPSPSTCQDGACVTPPLCKAGAASCADGKTLQVCAANGQSYELVPCAPGKQCVEGMCIAQGCSANQLQCAGDILQTCDPSGVWKNTLDCKQNAASCMNGACVVDPCIFGNYGCVDGTPAFCTKDSGWQKQAGCTAGQVCVNKGECKAKLCDPWQPFCQGSAAMLCDSSGTQGTPLVDCGTLGQVCKSGGCEPAPLICQPAAKQCQGSNLNTCNSSGTAWISSPCDDGDPCTTDGCSQDKCTKTTAPDGTACSGSGGTGCDTFACSQGKCVAQGSGIWQKTLGTPGGTGVPMRAQGLPDGSVQWAGQWFAAGSGAATAWLARTSPSGSLSANWPISGATAWTATAWSAQGTWIGRANEVLLIGNTGAPEVQVQIPPPSGYSWPSMVHVAAHPQGGAVAMMASSAGGSGYLSELIRIQPNGTVAWRNKTPVTMTAGIVAVGDGGDVRVVGNQYGTGVASSYHMKFASDGSAGAFVKLALSQWSAWTDFQHAKVAGSADVVVGARLYKPCSGCSGDWQDVGLARIGPDGAVIWQAPLLNPLGAEEQLSGLWIEGDTAVAVTSLGDYKQSGWTWYRLRLSDGKVVFSKNWSVSGSWGSFVPVAAPSGNGALIALRHPYGSSALSPLFRVDAWGNPSCNESAGCAAKTYASCDDGNACTLENCLAGVCLHPAAPDGFSCGAGKACSGGLCK